MALAAASGYPQLSGVTIPEIWSGKLLVKFYAATVLAAISNTDYEGEIASQGDKVIIRTTPTLTISDYTKGQALTYETPEPETINLLIDKAKKWGFVTDDVDQFQSDIDYIESWTMDASEQLKISIDTDILAAIFSSAHASNQGLTAGLESASINLGVTGTPLQVTKATILDLIVDAGTVLDEQNVPENDRWLLLPPWACGLIKKSDLKDASLAGDGSSIMRNGRVGMIDRFTIYNSNLLTKTTDGANTVFNAMFGQRQSLTFASQLVKNQTLTAERTFGEIYRGLQVFGYKVLKSEALGHLYVYK